MPRPRKCRRVQGNFGVYYFKPRGIKLRELEEVALEIDEIESFRLVDLEGLSMEEAAASMKVSGPTLCRLVNAARGKVADAICNGKAISIQNYNLTNLNMPNFDGTGPDGQGPKTGRQMGKCEGAKKSGSAAGTRRGLGGRQRMGRGRRRN